MKAKEVEKSHDHQYPETWHKKINRMNKPKDTKNKIYP